MRHGILEIGLITMKKELNEQTKDNIHHWCSSFLFNKTQREIKERVTSHDRYITLLRRRAEDHKEAKRIEEDLYI